MRVIVLIAIEFWDYWSTLGQLLVHNVPDDGATLLAKRVERPSDDQPPFRCPQRCRQPAHKRLNQRAGSPPNRVLDAWGLQAGQAAREGTDAAERAGRHPAVDTTVAAEVGGGAIRSLDADAVLSSGSRLLRIRHR